MTAMAMRESINQTLTETLAAKFPDLTVEHDRSGLPALCATPERYVEAVTLLRTDPELQFDILVQVYGAHYPDDEQPFEVVTRLASMTLGAQVAVKVRATGEPPSVPSLAPTWQAANWHERETYDMLGVHFTGHPDHRRIFLPEDADFHPLRKDFPTEGFED